MTCFARLDGIEKGDLFEAALVRTRERKCYGVGAITCVTA